MSICKRIGIITIITTLLLCSFPIYAFADDNVYQVGISEPTVSDNAGYVALLVENQVGDRDVLIIPFTYVQYNTATELFNKPYLQVEIYESNVELIFNTKSDNAYGYFNVFHHLGSSNSFGKVKTTFFNGVSSGFNYKLSTYHPDYFIVGGYVRGGNLGYYASTENVAFNVLWNNEAAFYNQYVYINESLKDIFTVLDTDIYSALDDILYEMVTSNSYNREQIEYLVRIYTELLNANITLDDIDSKLAQQNLDMEDLLSLTNRMYLKLSEIDTNTDELEELLKMIILALNSEGEEFVEDKASDKHGDKANDMYSKEDNLTGGSTSSSMGNMSNSIDSSSSGEVWWLVDLFLHSNNQVFTMFLTILSFGVVALILNR